jgi:HSP20 family molecular chaperone IbpA
LQVQNDKEKFGVKLDCSQFRPEELSVNVKGKELIIEGNHEAKSDQHGSIQRRFVRKYALPKNVNADGKRIF